MSTALVALGHAPAAISSALAALRQAPAAISRALVALGACPSSHFERSGIIGARPSAHFESLARPGGLEVASVGKYGVLKQSQALEGSNPQAAPWKRRRYVYIYVHKINYMKYKFVHTYIHTYVHTYGW